MAKVKLTKKEADRIMNIEDTTRGTVLITLRDYILNKKGKKGVEMVENRLKELGYSFRFKDFTASFKWYQGSFGDLIIPVILEVFHWDESKAFEIGYDSLIINSLITKLLMSRLISLETAFKNTPKFWHYFTEVGDMKFTEYDLDKRHAILRLDNYKKFHPTEYDYIRGNLAKILEMVTNSKNVQVEQTKSLFNNDSYDEFKITW